MVKVERFEDLIAWQKSRTLTRVVYDLTRQPSFARDYALAGQMQRASVSIMSNIAEGFERRSAADFFQFLAIAKASCAEVRSQLYVALDVGYIDQDTFNKLHTQADEVARIIGGLRTSVGKRRPAQTARQ